MGLKKKELVAIPFRISHQIYQITLAWAYVLSALFIPFRSPHFSASCHKLHKHKHIQRDKNYQHQILMIRQIIFHFTHNKDQNKFELKGENDKKKLGKCRKNEFIVYKLATLVISVNFFLKKKLTFIQ